MHKLDRNSVPAPTCLGAYHHGTHSWDDVGKTPGHKEEIRQQLELLQGRRCAYCEGSLDVLGQHIEHFRRKHIFQKLTFHWGNLFWSCDQDGHCGCFKDRKSGPYNPNDLIDPSLDDPEQYLHFFSDGSIRLRPGLNAAAQRRAEETLRVFNLDQEHGPLRHMRQAHCAGYIDLGIQLAELAVASTPEEWLPFLDEELANTRDLPFATAIKHTLTPA
ncbi:MAG: TIGR02646 family protein [Planctomycetaceae bacterium]|nr:TIGR02646 family protein [Planctomycetaceae bacterium]